MKRILTLALALLLCLCLAAPVLADVIYEPEDSFYQSHREECVRSEKNYIVSDSGAAVCTKPGGKAVGSYDPGDTVYADYLYTEPKTGDVWGSCMFRSDKGWEDGWVCLTGMQIVYDSRDFEAQYGAQFYSPDEDAAPTVKLWEVAPRLWSYPGAAEPDSVLDHYVDPERTYDADLILYFHTLFDDEAGNQWGFLGYWQGRRNQWICLSDPEAESLPVREIAPRYVEKRDAVGGTGGNAMYWLAVGLVAAVVVVTVLLLARR